MNFFAVDVETANFYRGSICQIGWAVVENGAIQQSGSILIDPQQPFSAFNIGIHGIDESMVVGAPTFEQVKEQFRSLMSAMPIVSYGLFDQAAFALADDALLETQFAPESPWLNAQRVVRRAWPEHFGRKYNLRLVADTLGLSLTHHDAGSDAKVAAQAVLLAADRLGMSFEELFVRAYQPLSPAKYDPITYEGGDDGPLAGEVITFTGALSLTRREAAKIANELGAGVAPSTTKKTTILIVGTQDSSKIVGDKSSKHRRAEELINDGHAIEILAESDFLKMIKR